MAAAARGVPERARAASSSRRRHRSPSISRSSRPVWLSRPRGVSADDGARRSASSSGGSRRSRCRIPSARRLGFRARRLALRRPGREARRSSRSRRASTATASGSSPSSCRAGRWPRSATRSSRSTSAPSASSTSSSAASSSRLTRVGASVPLRPGARERAGAPTGRRSRLALRLVGFVTIPSMIGLVLIARPIVDVIFRRGQVRGGGRRADGASPSSSSRSACTRRRGEDPDAGVLRAPRHADAGLRRHVRPRPSSGSSASRSPRR